MTINELPYVCQDSLSAFTGSDAVLDDLEVLEAALDEDHLDRDDVNVTKLTSGTKNTNFIA